MELLQLREKEVFETLKKLNEFKFVIIGGYAVNAYTLPRFSVDCDIVVVYESEVRKIQKALIELGYEKKEHVKISAFSNFERYEKTLDDNFKVSFDVFIKEVFDRQTKVSISAEWILENSGIRSLKGKTIFEELKLRIIDLDALFIMKMISCRSTDIRDIFMLAQNINNKNFIKHEVSSRYNFNNRLEKIKEKIISKGFRDGLQGIYGIIDNQIFEKSINAILSLNNV